MITNERHPYCNCYRPTYINKMIDIIIGETDGIIYFFPLKERVKIIERGEFCEFKISCRECLKLVFKERVGQIDIDEMFPVKDKSWSGHYEYN